jgi:hypothetical protein
MASSASTDAAAKRQRMTDEATEAADAVDTASKCQLTTEAEAADATEVAETASKRQRKAESEAIEVAETASKRQRKAESEAIEAAEVLEAAEAACKAGEISIRAYQDALELKDEADSRVAEVDVKAWVMKLPILGAVDRDKLLAWGREKYGNFRVVQVADSCEVGGFFRGEPPNLKKFQSLLATNLKFWGIARRSNYEKGWLVVVSAADARERLGLNQEAAMKKASDERDRQFEIAYKARERAKEIERQKVKACWMFARLVRTRERTGFEAFAARVRKQQAARQAVADEEWRARRAVVDEEWRARRARQEVPVSWREREA